MRRGSEARTGDGRGLRMGLGRMSLESRTAGVHPLLWLTSGDSKQAACCHEGAFVEGNLVCGGKVGVRAWLPLR